jgi:hypothetical protein
MTRSLGHFVPDRVTDEEGSAHGERDQEVVLSRPPIHGEGPGTAVDKVAKWI